MNNTVIITGGAGFIGSAVIRYLLKYRDYKVVNLDKLTYAGNEATMEEFADDPKYRFVHCDICDRDKVSSVFTKFRPSAIMHLAAESHVDRSIDGPWEFLHTNIVGTYNLLEVVRSYLAENEGDAVGGNEWAGFRFHHISTDEVFGTLGEVGSFSEESPYQPNSPYSASKASSDHLVRAWHETFGVSMVMSNCSNNYGPYQYPEKLIPVIIARALERQPIPVYGTGLNVRDWLYVDDHAEALVTIMEHGAAGRSYNVGGNAERTNLDVVRAVCRILDQQQPSPDGQSYESLIEFVSDRPGHDFRYAIDATRISTELGWQPRESFETGMEKTVQWYLQNQDWVEAVQRKNRLRGQRLGSMKRMGGAG